MSYQVETQMQDRINEVLLKKKIDLEQAVIKERYLNIERMDLAQKKIQLQEYRKEVHKAQYEEIIIDNNGELHIVTKNTLVEMPKRKLTNFLFSNIYRMVSSDGSSGIYMLCLKIDESYPHIYLNEEKIGNASYFMKKLMAVGGQIYANTKKAKENFLCSLWASLCAQCQQTVVVPVNVGWITEGFGSYKYIEEDEMLWADIIRKAK